MNGVARTRMGRIVREIVAAKRRDVTVVASSDAYWTDGIRGARA